MPGPLVGTSGARPGTPDGELAELLIADEETTASTASTEQRRTLLKEDLAAAMDELPPA